ncbi:MAG: hypothetical protein MHM6MM_001610 [Cercozoa sp. M6MM]
MTTESREETAVIRIFDRSVEDIASQLPLLLVQCSHGARARFSNYLRPHHLEVREARRYDGARQLFFGPIEGKSSPDFEHVQRELREDTRVFCALQQSSVLTHVFESLDALGREFRQHFPKDQLLRIQASDDVKRKLIRDLPDEIRLSPRASEFDAALCVVRIGGKTQNKERVLVGIVPRELNFATAPKLVAWRSQPRTCWAYNKLAEAMTLLKIRDLTGKLAIDCGAAPGGWTEYLSDAHCQKVIAIDPADMTPSVVRRHNVSYLQMRVEQAIETGQLAGVQADLLVCDANVSPALLTEILTPLITAAHLVKGAILCITVKLPQPGQHVADRECQQVCQHFAAQGVHDMQVHHLFANRQERTILGIFD